jgi:hypothetical protein
MPGVLAPVTYESMKAVRQQSGGMGVPTMKRELEAATQTFLQGVPVMLNGSGYLVEFSSSGANIIYGISYEPAHNLSTAGTGQNENEGSPINQPNAVTTAIGAWIRDGRCGVYEANALNVFSIVMKLGQVFTQALLVAGTLYGITKDTGNSNLWFMDNTATSGNSAVLQLLELDPSCPNSATAGTRVLVQIGAAKRYFS